MAAKDLPDMLCGHPSVVWISICVHTSTGNCVRWKASPSCLANRNLGADFQGVPVRGCTSSAQKCLHIIFLLLFHTGSETTKRNFQKDLECSTQNQVAWTQNTRGTLNGEPSGTGRAGREQGWLWWHVLGTFGCKQQKSTLAKFSKEQNELGLLAES